MDVVPTNSWQCQKCSARFSTREQVRMHLRDCGRGALATNVPTNDYQVFREPSRGWSPVEVEATTAARREAREAMERGEEIWEELEGEVQFQGKLRLVSEDVPLGMLDSSTLVCAMIGEPGVGNVPARCGQCGEGVFIAREFVKMWGGRAAPPAVRCRECVARADERYWQPLVSRTKVYTVQENVDVTLMEYLTTQLDAMNAMKLSIDVQNTSFKETSKKVETMTQAWQDGPQKLCIECGSPTKGGNRHCQKCTRRAWRRRT